MEIFEPIIKQSVSSRVANALRKAILDGVFEPGTELRQDMLARHFSVSRIPVREALQLLERDGLLTVKPNRRMIVTALTDQDLYDHYRVRAVVEGEAAACAALCADKTEIEALEELAAGASATGDLDAFVSANEEFHRAVWKAAGNQRLVRTAQQLWTGILPYTPLLLPAHSVRSVEEHRLIVTAIREQLPEEARSAMSNHIMRSGHDLRRYLAHASARIPETPGVPRTREGPDHVDEVS